MECEAILEGEENRILSIIMVLLVIMVSLLGGYNGSVGGGGAITGFLMRQVTDVNGDALLVVLHGRVMNLVIMVIEMPW